MCPLLYFSIAHQEATRQHFSHLFQPFEGPVRCKNPERHFLIIERHEPQQDGSVVSVGAPSCVYIGKELHHTAGRRLVSALTLKKRTYLGPTSMDNELSLVMANMGLVRKGSVVLDPFVGTGSILVACANFGAVCFGTDIDVRVLR